LNIPLFNANQTKNKIKLAEIDLKNSEILEKNTKIELQQTIEDAYVHLLNSLKKYKILQDKVKSFSESFRSAEIRFNAGAINSVDYLIAKNNLDRAKINLIISKYDFVLRRKVLEHYRAIK
jgi:outer membrane protein